MNLQRTMLCRFIFHSLVSDFLVNNTDQLLDFRFGDLGVSAQSLSFEFHFFVDQRGKDDDRQVL